MDMLLDTVLSSSFFWWGVGVSVITVVVFLPGAAWVLLRLPPDFLQRDQHSLVERLRKGGWWWGIVLILKNLIALFFLVAGVVMLFIPGQGVLAIIAGLVLLDFPGKRALERSIITQQTVLSTVNWLRRWFDQPELIVREDRQGTLDESV